MRIGSTGVAVAALSMALPNKPAISPTRFDADLLKRLVDWHRRSVIRACRLPAWSPPGGSPQAHSLSVASHQKVIRVERPTNRRAAHPGRDLNEQNSLGPRRERMITRRPWSWERCLCGQTAEAAGRKKTSVDRAARLSGSRCTAALSGPKRSNPSEPRAIHDLRYGSAAGCKH